MKLNRMLVVLSAERTELSAELNAERTCDLQGRLVQDNFSFDRAEGCYKGDKEVSFVVQVENFREVLMLLRMSHDYGQECIMLVDARNKAFLLFNDKRSMVGLGRLQEAFYEPLSEHVDAYTKVGDTYYYVYNFNQEV